MCTGRRRSKSTQGSTSWTLDDYGQRFRENSHSECHPTLCSRTSLCPNVHMMTVRCRGRIPDLPQLSDMTMWRLLCSMKFRLRKRKGEARKSVCERADMLLGVTVSFAESAEPSKPAVRSRILTKRGWTLITQSQKLGTAIPVSLQPSLLKPKFIHRAVTFLSFEVFLQGTHQNNCTTIL